MQIIFCSGDLLRRDSRSVMQHHEAAVGSNTECILADRSNTAGTECHFESSTLRAGVKGNVPAVDRFQD